MRELSQTQISHIVTNPPWAGATSRPHSGLMGKEWLSVAEAMAWIYCGRPARLWRWPVDVFGLPEGLPTLPVEELIKEFFGGSGNLVTAIRASQTVDLINAEIVSNNNERWASAGRALDDRGTAFGAILAECLNGRSDTALAYQAAIRRAREAAPKLRRVRQILHGVLSCGHMWATGIGSDKPRGPVPSHYFSERTTIIPTGILLHDTDGMLVRDLRVDAEVLSNVAPAGPIAEVEEKYLDEHPTVSRKRAADMAAERRSRGGSPGKPSRAEVKKLFEAKFRATATVDTVSAVATALLDAASALGTDDLPNHETAKGWVKSWLNQPADGNSR